VKHFLKALLHEPLVRIRLDLYEVRKLFGGSRFGKAFTVVATQLLLCNIDHLMNHPNSKFAGPPHCEPTLKHADLTYVKACLKGKKQTVGDYSAVYDFSTCNTLCQ
jgi:hypothetical protein